MNELRFQWILLSFVALASLAIGVTSIQQQRSFSKKLTILESALLQPPVAPPQGAVTRVTGAVPTPTPSDANTESPLSLVKELPAQWNGQSPLNIVHRCLGSIQRGSGSEGQSFCLGRNQLVVETRGQGEQIVSDVTITKPEEAPILSRVLSLADSGNGAVLISYTPQPCATIDDCGVGNGGQDRLNLAYFGISGESKALRNIPGPGTFAWNHTENKALVVPDTCGGTGCTTSEILGYDLTSDSVRTVTTEKAAGDKDSESSPLSSADGTTLPRWKNLRWTNESQFTADIVSPSGAIRRVNGSF